MKIRPVVAEFREDGQTYTKELIVAFRNFANACNKIVRCETVSRLYHPDLCYNDMILLIIIIKRYEMYV